MKLGSATRVSLGWAALTSAVLGLSGCGGKVSTELVPYFDEFYRDAGRLGVEIEPWSGSAELTEEIDYQGENGEYPEGPWGLCNKVLKKIHFKREAWDQLGHYGRRMLVYHELGHCVLDREHVEGLSSVTLEYPYSVGGFPIELQLPNSVMHPGVIGTEEDLALGWKALVEELMLNKPIPDTPAAIDATEAEALRQHWRELLAPGLANFVQAAKDNGVTITAPELDFRTRIGENDPPPGFLVYNFARNTSWWLPYTSEEAQEISPVGFELILFGMLAEHSYPKTDYDYRVEVRHGLHFPKSLRAFTSAFGNPEYEDFYTANRASFLRELFTGNFGP